MKNWLVHRRIVTQLYKVKENVIIYKKKRSYSITFTNKNILVLEFGIGSWKSTHTIKKNICELLARRMKKSVIQCFRLMFSNFRIPKYNSHLDTSLCFYFSRESKEEIEIQTPSNTYLKVILLNNKVW